MNDLTHPFIAHVRESDKAEQSLADHLIAVAALARRHAAKIGLGEAGELIGLLHDLGKYSAKFQGYLRSATGLIDFDEDAFVDATAEKGKIDHSTAGAQYMWRALKDKGNAAVCLGQLLAVCVASHHSGLIDCVTSSSDHFGVNNFARRMDKEDSRSHFQECIANADRQILSRAEAILLAPRLVLRFRTAYGRSRKPRHRPAMTEAFKSLFWCGSCSAA